LTQAGPGGASSRLLCHRWRFNCLCAAPSRACSLGYCCIKEKEYERALQAFSRSSQLEPDNGEAWNNLAAIHMHLHRWRHAYNALSGAAGDGAGGRAPLMTHLLSALGRLVGCVPTPLLCQRVCPAHLRCPAPALPQRP
jgi:thioredoxin-like negative regulator of GroEL